LHSEASSNASSPLSYSTYSSSELEAILERYRILFPKRSITPELRAYWDWVGEREWSGVTTDFHSATPEQLQTLHERSLNIEAGGLSMQAKGEALRQAARHVGVGFSAGVCPWTDNLLLETFNPQIRSGDLVVLVGHDWYPIGAGVLPESPLYNQGLGQAKRYRHWCPESFFGDTPNRPTLFFLNFYPDFRPPAWPKKGPLHPGHYPYNRCLDGLKEVLRILTPQFKRTSVISWGSPAWTSLAPLVDGGPIRRTITQQQKEKPGAILSLGGSPFLPMAHPSMGSNHHKPHLREGYRQLGLGGAPFDRA
jgi:hypothetical protein